MINHDVDDRHFAVDVVLFVETGKCIVWDHRTKELFSVDLPEVHANSIVGLGVENNYEYVDVRGITHVIWSPVHVTPIVMVFLSELISEIRDMDHSLKRELFEAYNTMGANSSNLADDDAFASDQKSSNNTSLGNASENGSKSTVMIRISNLEFDIGCAPVTEETVKIIFNKPVDIVLSTDILKRNNSENTSLLSYTISVPDLHCLQGLHD